MTDCKQCVPKNGEPKTILGGLAVDDRGSVSFVNDFDMQVVRRFYVVRNHRSGFIRAWHAHRREAKYAYVMTGSAIVAAVKIDNWEHPSKNATVHRQILSAQKPAVFFIPSGFANGFMTLTSDAVVMFLSTATLEESMGDDVRYPADYWNPWDVECR